MVGFGLQSPIHRRFVSDSSWGNMVYLYRPRVDLPHVEAGQSGRFLPSPVLSFLRQEGAPSGSYRPSEGAARQGQGTVILGTFDAEREAGRRPRRKKCRLRRRFQVP